MKTRLLILMLSAGTISFSAVSIRTVSGAGTANQQLLDTTVGIIANKLDKSSVTKTVATPGTDTKVPTEKAVRDAINSAALHGILPVPGVDYFDGRPGAPALTCMITGGTRSITYDAVGLNPQPAILSFGAVLYEGSSLLTVLRYSWSTGPAPRQVYGSGTGSTFTPSVYGTYSASRANNYVAVQLTYSTASLYGGKRICSAHTPVSVTKIGATGIQGPAGQDATVTEPAVRLAFENTASNSPFILRTTSGTQSKVEVWDTSSNTRMYVDTNGYLYFKAANGDVVARIQSDGTLYLLNGATTPRVKIDNHGTITTYATNGSTPVFQLYSTGRSPNYEPPAGNPSVDGYCWKSTTAGVRSWGSCGTGGSGTPGGSTKQYQYNNAGAFAGSAFLGYTSNGVILKGAVIIK